jgi:Transposase DDE domain
VSCPRGVDSASWTPAVDNRATAVIEVKFSRRDCGTCVDRAACAGPDADRRLMTLRRRSEHEALAGARRRQQAPDFAAVHAWRAGVEATMSWAVRGFGLRRARYVGLAKVRLQHTATAAALDLVRLTRGIMGCSYRIDASQPLHSPRPARHPTSPAGSKLRQSPFWTPIGGPASVLVDNEELGHFAVANGVAEVLSQRSTAFPRC